MVLRVPRKFALLWLFLLAAALFADTLPGVYIVDLTTEPVARLAQREHAQIHRPTASLIARRTAILDEQRRVRTAAESAGAEVIDAFQLVHNALVVRIPPDRAARLNTLDGVRAVRPVRLYRKLLDHALPLENVLDAWTEAGGFDKAGAGARIAIIDTGIDLAHPAFSDGGFTAPAGFPKVIRQSDLAYTNAKVIVARSYANPATGVASPAADIDGHGTGVAMIAGGWIAFGPYGPVAGVAPGAYLGSYKVFPDGLGGAPDSLIIRALEDAVSDGMDVMNLSLGSFPAVRPGDDELVFAVENAVAAGKVVTIAIGNDGATPNTVASPATSPSALSVGSSNNSRSFMVRLLVDGHDPYVALPGDGANSATPVTGPIVDITAFDSTGLGCDAFPAGSLTGAIALIQRGTCYFETKLLNAQAAGAAGAVIYARSTAPDPVNFAVGAATLPALMIANGDGVALRAALGSGALHGTLDFSPFAVPADAARISSFSSLGPSSDYSIKPDLLAIGENLSTARPVSQGGYVVEGGTSFSAPAVAGAAALLIAARPGLTPAEYKSLLVNAASPFTITGGALAGVQSAGAGLLNVSAAVRSTITASPVSLSFGSVGSTVKSTLPLTLTNTSAAPDTFSIAVTPVEDGPAPTVAANTIALDAGASGAVSVALSSSGLAAGVYQGVLSVQGSRSPSAIRIPYWFGVPSEQPRYFQLIQAPSTARRGGVFDIAFRVLDVNGLPVTKGVYASIVTGATTAGIDTFDYAVPGAFVVHLLAGAARGTLTIQFVIDGVPAIDPISVQVQ